MLRALPGTLLGTLQMTGRTKAVLRLSHCGSRRALGCQAGLGPQLVSRGICRANTEAGAGTVTQAPALVALAMAEGTLAKRAARVLTRQIQIWT